MSDERRYYESIRRRASRAQVRLTETLAQSRIATARDKRTNERHGTRDSFETRLGSKRDVARFGERAGELGEDRQVGVEPDPLQPADAERQQRPFVLEPAELALDGGAARVELAPARAVSRGISGWRRSALIHRLAGLHSPVGQRHLVAPRLESDPANRHSPCSHVGGLWSPRLTAGVSRSGMIGRHVARLAGVVDRRRCRSPCPSRTSRPRSRARAPRRSAARRAGLVRAAPSRPATRAEGRSRVQTAMCSL